MILILTIAAIALSISLFASLADLWIELFVISSLTMMCLPIVMFLQRKKIDVFEPVWSFTALYVISYGYKAVLIIYDPDEFITFPQYFPNHLDTMLYACFLSLIGLGAFYLGYFPNFANLFTKYTFTMSDEAIRRSRLYFASILGICIANAQVIIFVRRTLIDFDWKNIFYNPIVRSELMANIFGSGLTIVFMALSPIFALGYFYYILNEKFRFSRLVFSLLILALAALPIAIIGNRLLFLGLLISLVAIYHYKVKQVNIAVILAFMTVMAWAAGALGMLVYPGDYSFISPYDIVRRLSGTFEFFDHFVTAIAHVHEHFWGLTLLEDLTITYLPRTLIPMKPLIYGQLRLQETILPGLYAASSFSATMAMGILAEGYVNFGLLGVFLLPFMLGVFFKALYEKAMKDGGLYIVILSFATGTMLLAIRGFGSYITMMLLTLCAVWLFYRMNLRILIPLKKNILKAKVIS